MNEHTATPAIDLNADVGEDPSANGLSVTQAISGIVTSVNIACGGHAGDASTMRHAIRAAVRHGTAVGAHPSYPDRMNFGRVPMGLSPAAVRETVRDQLRQLQAIASEEHVALVHCKPHGALYHAASGDRSIAMAILQACADANADLRLVGQAGSRAIDWWRAAGARVAEEAFADRVYNADGSLRSRTLPDATIVDPEVAAAQAVLIATARTVRAHGGPMVPLAADSICLHADSPGAVAIAEQVSGSLRRAGVTVRGIA